MHRTFLWDAKTSQEPKKIILYLDSGADYLLKMTNGQASMPHYDLQDFKDSLSFSIPIAKLLPVEIIPSSSKTKSFFSENSLWITLFGLLIVLIYFTVKLAGEIPNKK